MLLFSPFPPALAEMIRETFSWTMFVIIQETRALKYIVGMKDMTKTSQELRKLSSSLSDCKSLPLNVTIQVSQFVSNSQLCH